MLNKFFVIEQAKLARYNKKNFDNDICFDYSNVLGWDYEVQDWYTLYFGLFFIDYFKLNKEQCIDVGALKGLYSSVYARHFKNVHTFEPNPYAHAICKMNFNRQDIHNVSLYNVALFNEEKETDFYMKFFDKKKTNITGQSNTEKEIIQENGLVTEKIKVNTKTLDSYNFNPSFIKIDAEGANLNILKGALKTIKRYKPFLQIENDTALENNPVIEDMLFNLGYSKIDLNSFKYIYNGSWDLTDSYFLHNG